MKILHDKKFNMWKKKKNQKYKEKNSHFTTFKLFSSSFFSLTLFLYIFFLPFFSFAKCWSCFSNKLKIVQPFARERDPLFIAWHWRVEGFNLHPDLPSRVLRLEQVKVWHEGYGESCKKGWRWRGGRDQSQQTMLLTWEAKKEGQT